MASPWTTSPVGSSPRKPSRVSGVDMCSVCRRVVSDRGVARADSWDQTTCTKALCSIAAPCDQRWPTTWSERRRSSEKAVRLSGWHSTKCGILMYMPPRPLPSQLDPDRSPRAAELWCDREERHVLRRARYHPKVQHSAALYLVVRPGRECAHSPSCPRTTVKGIHVRRAPMFPRCVPTETCIKETRLS